MNIFIALGKSPFIMFEEFSRFKKKDNIFIKHIGPLLNEQIKWKGIMKKTNGESNTNKTLYTNI